MKKSVLSFVRISLVGFAALSVAAPAYAAPLSYTGGNYSQNFDTLPSTGSGSVANRGPNYINGSWTGITGSNLTGWQFANPTGSAATTEYRAGDGSGSGSTGRGVLSLGTTGSSDRALGALSTSNQIPNFGLVLTNNTSQLLTSFTLSFTGEQWRRGDAVPQDKLLFSWGLGSDISGSYTSASVLDFSSPNPAPSSLNSALDGNLAINQTALSATITGINWGVGQTLVLKWTAQELSGQDDALGIDNLTFSAVPEPSSLALAAIGLIGLVGYAVRRRRAS